MENLEQNPHGASQHKTQHPFEELELTAYLGEAGSDFGSEFVQIRFLDQFVIHGFG